MKKLILIFILALLTPQAYAATAPVAAISASRTTGVEPLCVVFDGSGSSDADLGANEAFRKLSYSWNFGDSSAGTFTNGSVAQSRNMALETPERNAL